MATEQEQPIEQATIEGTTVGEDGISTELNELIIQLEEKLRTDKNTINKLKAIRKNAAKLEKKKVRRTRTTKAGKESGFGRPVGISQELAKFLGVAEDTMVSRTTVRNNIHEYAKTHNIRKPTDLRYFDMNLEAAKDLRKLLNVAPEEEVSYFNLQRYLKNHFIKKDVPAQPAEASKDVKTKTQEVLREAELPAEAPKKKTIIRKKVRPDAQEV